MEVNIFQRIMFKEHILTCRCFQDPSRSRALLEDKSTQEFIVRPLILQFIPPVPDMALLYQTKSHAHACIFLQGMHMSIQKCTCRQISQSALFNKAQSAVMHICTNIHFYLHIIISTYMSVIPTQLLLVCTIRNI